LAFSWGTSVGGLLPMEINLALYTPKMVAKLDGSFPGILEYDFVSN
jgi:hypothetical protein